MPAIDPRTGVLLHKPQQTAPGYTLFSPMGLPHTYLIDMDGEVVHRWDLPGDIATNAYLLENGNLLAAVCSGGGPKKLPAGGGRLVELGWHGQIVWEHIDHAQHHDFRRRANGNTVYLAWELLDAATQAKVPGGVPGTEHDDGIYGDVIREVDPAGNLVWDWHAAQEVDMDRFPLNPAVKREEYAHANTIFPCPNGDMIINWRFNNTMAMIDRKTKKMTWFLRNLDYGQHHDVQLLDSGNILFFANGANTLQPGPENGSRVVEIDPKTNAEVWSYQGTPPRSFMSWFISGCQRLDNGNTLICEGLWGHLFEVTPAGEMVWSYVSPFFVDKPHPVLAHNNCIFRCYRYAAESTQINGRLPGS